MKARKDQNSFFLTITIIITIFLLKACTDTASVQNASSEIQNHTLEEVGRSKISDLEIDSSGTIKDEYIVTFKNQFQNRIDEQTAQQADQLREEILAAHQIKKEQVLNRYTYAIKGFAAKLNDKQLEELKSDTRVLRITPNKLMNLGVVSSSKKVRTTPPPATMQGGQIVPWGVSRVGGPFDNTGKKAWIIDSGIDLDHPDLNVDTGDSKSYIPGQNADDINGHGTHVAGILAAKDNSIGVVGVAAGATVVAVKVCYASGPSPCPFSSILDGIDYVTNKAQNGDVINMSLWNPGGINHDWDDAVTNAASSSKQLRFSLIAGNASGNASNYSPGRTGQHSYIWTASAYNNNDAFATSFSNYGDPPIDFGGPGVNIPSLSIGSGTTNKSGTSMAAPHIAGIILNQGTRTTSDPGDYPEPTDGTVSSDPDGNPDEITVASDLETSVSGPTFVGSGNQGNWSANVSGGDSPYNYTWYRSVTNPYYWQQVGTGSSYSQTVTQSMDLKVRVTDDDNVTVTSEVHSVTSF